MEWDLWAGLREAERQELLGRARRRRYNKGDIVFHEGDPAHALHLVAAGRFAVRVTTPLGDTATLSVVGPGGWFGELAIVADAPRNATVAALDPRKDVDGLTPASAGLLARGEAGLVPCTPRGILELLNSVGVDPAGKEAVIVGRSNLVGRPLFSLLLGANATVTVCHSRTKDLLEVCRRGEILVAAAGSPRLIGAEMIGPGATVIDVGTNRTDDGLVGDVDFDAALEVAGAITPVPGGVGPMTIAMLLSNTVDAARARAAATARSG